VRFASLKSHPLRRLLGAACLACVLASFAAPASGPARAAESLIRSGSIQPFYFSPDGNSIADVTTLRFVLNDTATVHLFVLEQDSVTVVDTLVAGVLLPNLTEHAYVWDGRYFNGALAAEDTFIAYIEARNDSEADSLFSAYMFIDITAPEVTITNIDPGLIAPGSSDPGQTTDTEITYVTADPPPTDSVEVDIIVYGPTGGRVETLPERLAAANGTHKDVWDGSVASDDGLHKIEITARDRALNATTTWSYVDVNIDGPMITITNLENNTTIAAPPDSLYGMAWDRHGLRDSVWVRYATDDPFTEVATKYFKDDTLFFAVPLASEIVDEGSYTLGFRAKDLLGQVNTQALTFTYTTATAPILNEPDDPVTRSPDFILNGTVSGAASFVLRIYQNDALIDSTFPNVPGNWPYPMTLVPGLNRIYAVMGDDAGNVSEPSNTIEITFDNSAGLFIPQPFNSGDAFQVNLSKNASSITLRLYDLGGSLVKILYGTTVSSNTSIPWDALNGDGEEVNTGPFVAVAEIVYADGSGREIIREIFFCEP
jgi:hypothetical protein